MIKKGICKIYPPIKKNQFNCLDSAITLGNTI